MTAVIPAKTQMPKRRHYYRELIGAAFTFSILGLALWFLHRELATLSAIELIDHLRSIPMHHIALALVFCVGSYATLTLYDFIAVRYVAGDLPYRPIAATSFTAFAIGHNVGLAALSGGSVRYRMYTALGLSAFQITKIIAFLSITFFLGAAPLIGIALLSMPLDQASALHASPHLIRGLAVTALLVPVAYLTAVVVRKEPVRVGHWQIGLPNLKLACLQIVVAMVDLMFACAVLYILLAGALNTGFLSFLGVYLVAMGAGVLSSVPGGIGVFESLLLLLLPQVDKTLLLGSIVVFRLLYYVLPLCLALILLAQHELRNHGATIKRGTATLSNGLSAILPQALGLGVFLGGVVLLISGAIPSVESRLQFVVRVIPLPVLELSHLVGSIVGVTLLVVAQGLLRRLHRAFLAAISLLLLGILASILKGFDVEEALILTGVCILLWISRKAFYRQSEVLRDIISVRWLLTIAMALGLSIWIGFVSYRQVDYQNQLWWQFALNGDAPRMLRATLSASVVLLGVLLWKALRPVAVKPPQPLDEQAIKQVLSQAQDSTSNVALLGDKQFLWSQDRCAFLMYAVSGNSWIALGSPVGPQDAQETLAWAFRDLVDREGGQPVFYQVRADALPLCVDMGLSVAKLGEEAHVELTNFSLEGSRRAELRQTVNRAKRNGSEFQIISAADLAPELPTLRRISDEWLSEKSAAEKGFSIGAFSETYIRHFDCAIVKVQGNTVAFANLWVAPTAGELSIDLMRFSKDAPKGTMDYLFTELMLWGHGQGYTWFNLGMAPLSGLETHPLAPVWHKIGNLIFDHGEDFYNFEGLRLYKEKFDPQWHPRYLACRPGVLQLPRALFDSSRLISGGVRGLIQR